MIEAGLSGSDIPKWGLTISVTVLNSGAMGTGELSAALPKESFTGAKEEGIAVAIIESAAAPK